MENVNKKSKFALAVFIITLVYYVTIIIVGFVGSFTDMFAGIAGKIVDASAASEKLGISIREVNVAYAKTVSFLFIVMSSSIFYLFATQKIFNTPKAVRVVLFILGVICSIVLTVVYFNFKSGFNKIFTVGERSGLSAGLLLNLSVIIGDIGFLVFYIFSVIVRSPESVRNKIIRTIAKLVQTDVFKLIITVALTVLLIPLAIVLVMLVIALIALFFLAAFMGGGSNSSSSKQTTTYLVNENGFTRELQFYDRYNGKKRYRDDLGYFWYSDDEHTFYKE